MKTNTRFTLTLIFATLIAAAPAAMADGNCGELTYEGTCYQGAAVWCEDGEVKAADCASGGMTCGTNDKGLADCLKSDGATAPTAESGGGCPDGLTYEGTCNGAQLSWCENGEAKSLDCASHELACGANQEKGYNDCVAQSTDTSVEPSSPSSPSEPSEPQADATDKDPSDGPKIDTGGLKKLGDKIRENGDGALGNKLLGGTGEGDSGCTIGSGTPGGTAGMTLLFGLALLALVRMRRLA